MARSLLLLLLILVSFLHLKVMSNIGGAALKAKAWTFEAKAINIGFEAPRGQGSSLRTTSLRIPAIRGQLQLGLCATSPFVLFFKGNISVADCMPKLSTLTAASNAGAWYMSRLYHSLEWYTRV